MTMAVTYYAVKPITVEGELREPGDLIPEAALWPYLSGYLMDGKLAPVLVATLPKGARDALAEWEADIEEEQARVVQEAETVAIVNAAAQTPSTPYLPTGVDQSADEEAEDDEIVEAEIEDDEDTEDEADDEESDDEDDSEEEDDESEAEEEETPMALAAEEVKKPVVRRTRAKKQEVTV